MIFWLLAVGLVTILGQVVLLRELNVAFYGSELIYILAMGMWLLWTAVGAALGSAEVHETAELGRLQAALAQRIGAFDERICTPQRGSPLPIRTLPIGKEEDAILATKMLMENGVYTSAIFFPTVARGAAGLRICLTASHSLSEVQKLCGLIEEVRNWQAFDPPSSSTKLAS